MNNYIEIPIDKLALAPWNYKEENEEILEKLKNNIKINGQIENIVVREMPSGFYEVINGNHRLKAFKDLEFSKVFAYNLGKISEGRAQRIALELNETRFETNDLKLGGLLKDILSSVPFSNSEIDDLLKAVEFDFDIDAGDLIAPSTLVERYIAPPFSVLDTRQGYWQDRKREWIDLGIKSEEGREENLLNYSDAILSGGYTDSEERDSGISIFDPVLAEIAYSWFCPKGGSILDPFAGGSVRRIVAGATGFDYTGIDLRSEQIKENKKQAINVFAKLEKSKGFRIGRANWIKGNSLNMIPKDSQFDFVFSCPPYFDLEKYSKDPEDLSNLSYEEFKDQYQEIISKAVARLKENRFACFVVSDIRDKAGYYRGFREFTIECFEEAGAKKYNEMILLNTTGNLAMRAGKVFSSFRKILRCHQDILVFYKGNPKKIKGIFKEEEAII